MFPPALLHSFITVARAGSFSKAGQELGLGQSTISEHVRRLEGLTGKRLFVRDTHSVSLTADGGAMLSFAQTILDANDQARRYFAGSRYRERLRLGATETFVRRHLADLLRDFQARHPQVDLELTVRLSPELFSLLDGGSLDMVLATGRVNATRGEVVRREKLTWLAAPEMRLDRGAPVPLVVFPPPSVSRALAIEALDRAGLPWRVVCSCNGLTGLQAATLAGVGVMVQPESMVPAELVPLPQPHPLPDPGELDLVVAGAGRRLQGPAAELAEVIFSHWGKTPPG